MPTDKITSTELFRTVLDQYRQLTFGMFCDKLGIRMDREADRKFSALSAIGSALLTISPDEMGKIADDWVSAPKLSFRPYDITNAAQAINVLENIVYYLTTRSSGPVIPSITKRHVDIALMHVEDAIARLREIKDK